MPQPYVKPPCPARLLASLAAALLLAIAPAPLAPARAETGAAGAVTIAGCDNYAPYSDAALPGDGFANDLTATILRQAGYRVSVTMLPWVRALDGTEAGNFDILPSAWYSTDRAAALLFSMPIAMSRLVFIKPAGSPFEFHTLRDLAGLRVGTISGYTYTSEFLAAPAFQRLEQPDILMNLRRLATGHIDLTIEDELTARFIIQSRAPELAPLLAYTRGVLSKQGLFVTFSKKRPDAEKLRDAFNAGLARMQADGSYRKLLALHQMLLIEAGVVPDAADEDRERVAGDLAQHHAQRRFVARLVA
jgi:polar amino acid transport system substrate-binding protein